MRPKIYTSLAGAIAVFSLLQSRAQTNKALSNLTAPTAINQSLLPDVNNSKDLGGSSLAWRNLYLSNQLYLNGKTVMHAPGATNFFAGINAGNAALSGYNNTAAGANALSRVTSGVNNTATGYSALLNTTTGRENTAVGYWSLLLNTTGSFNTATGSWALNYNTNGNNNTAYGYSALWQNRSGNDNTAIGKYAMYNNTTGYSNVALGTGALYKNSKGQNLVAIGDSALFNYEPSSGYFTRNSAIGSKALYATTSGSDNTATGYNALFKNKDGDGNTATGVHTLSGNTSGNGNTAYGGFALMSSSKQNYNTAVGYNAMAVEVGSYNTAIGASAMYGYSPDISYSTAIGYQATVSQSNQVRIGNNYITSIGGAVGWTVFSDGRFKKDIQEDVSGLAFINSLRPVTYKVEAARLHAYLNKSKEGLTSSISKQENAENTMLNRATEKADAIIHTGFVAQEVEEAANKLGYAFDGVDKPEREGGLYGLRYDGFVAPLVKAVQELSKLNNEKDSLIVSLEERMMRLEKAVGTGNSLSHSVNVSAAALGQNTPNPFAGATTIQYMLPQKVTNAQIVITDTNGTALKRISVSGTGKGIVTVDASSLRPGTYNYSLVVDGKPSGSKQLIVIK